MHKLIVLLSVDWEPDHGKWRYAGREVDYGGILKATPVFMDILDRLELPFTWFVETSYDPKRDTPSLFPRLIKEVAARKQDEVGLHIHWRRHNGSDKLYYEMRDEGWVAGQVAHGVRQLEGLGVRPKAFRSGALLHIPGLPRILHTCGIAVDSSTLWGECNRVDITKTGLVRKNRFQRLMAVGRRLCGGLSAPYLTDDNDVEKSGRSPLVEFPIAYSLYEARAFKQQLLYKHVVKQAGRHSGTTFLVIFFHIDELLLATSGPDLESKPEPLVVRHFAQHLSWLKSEGARFMVFSDARRHWLDSAEGLSRPTPDR